MSHDSDSLNRLFRSMTARKISVISRLAGLNEEQIAIMRLRWLDNKTDLQICDELHMSTATLTRHRKQGHDKIIDAMDLYGLSDFESLPASDILDYNGLFYKAQDELIRFFVQNKDDPDAQERLLTMLKLFK